jgi:hypothetical protein
MKKIISPFTHHQALIHQQVHHIASMMISKCKISKLEYDRQTLMSIFFCLIK